MRTKLPTGPAFSKTGNVLKDLSLNTVCKGAKCPNIHECFSRHVATFLIMGKTCTRNCSFCNIKPGQVEALDSDEPYRVAEGAKQLKLSHVVITSVTRDDLQDGGAGHFSATIRAVRDALPQCSIEVLIPDFKGSAKALDIVMFAKPNIINHNVETVPELYDTVRPQADFKQSLFLLQRVKKAGIISKSGFMVGLGETDEQVKGLIRKMAAIGIDMLTIGQYMQPSKAHPQVKRYVHPDIFSFYRDYGLRLGIKQVFSAPKVRSSYNADQLHNACGCKKL